MISQLTTFSSCGRKLDTNESDEETLSCISTTSIKKQAIDKIFKDIAEQKMILAVIKKYKDSKEYTGVLKYKVLKNLINEKLGYVKYTEQILVRETVKHFKRQHLI